ncbi:MAG: hypothetical protein INR62_05595 [Rhodospirillales bacterium]|nr:hypothetical protein [Acetobacter sp.]
MGRIGFRALIWLVAVAIIFALGWAAGGSLGTGSGQRTEYQRVVACLPAHDQVALDACLSRGH